MSVRKEEIVIIGSGIAGLTAAIYMARGGAKPLVIIGEGKGGQTATTHEIENYPGFENGISGFELMDATEKQAKRVGAQFISDSVVDLDVSDQNAKKVILGNGDIIEAQVIIVATGCSPRLLSVPGEKEFSGKGVAYCAVCDGFFYRGRKVAIVGGGNTAVSEAIYLSNIASEVYLIHRTFDFRAEQILVDEMNRIENIHIIGDNQVKEICANDAGVNKVKINNLKTHEDKEIEIDGIFVAIGKLPNTKFLEGKIDLYPNGFVKLETQHTETKIKGLFVCGDIASPHQQIVIAAGQGASAAIEAQEYLQKLPKKI